ncbi:nucleotidyltransferase [Furfurilactobacillus siliginis]|uniref:tRNA(Met) cytidine acetate ligase n=1 Tax=Furfurilactobacillus siliginis TaxID=348151 RepID=A0A0R2L0X0_9LACO|nr:nucleotidyltransferase [Furfurilactobacillus siliginis]KRN95088.1 hypothetical protein IV55_GL000370 [Furfurilactobacillus siliginis]GEK28345.1 UPF0348 protein [Furfurilactobacillus siliginis]
MRAVGVVTEYNPFHNGHAYHLQQARAVTGADVVVAVMSGNFVQRGEAAIFDKWQRANEALHNGADVVIELPFQWAVQPAHIFAQGALELLSAMKIDTMVFGAEHPETDFSALAKVPMADSTAFKQFDRTFATQFNEVFEAQTGFKLDQPNDILGYGYARANEQLAVPLKLRAVGRRGSAYHQTTLSKETFSSATAIRQAVLTQESAVQISDMVPGTTLADVQAGRAQPGWSDTMWALLRHTLLMTPVDELQQIYQMSEGLEYRLQEAAEKSATWQDFLTAIKTKRYTYSRLQRVCLYTLLHATTTDMRSKSEAYLRLLGFTEIGQQFLHETKKDFTRPLITRFDQHLKTGQLNLDYRAGMLYEMLTGTQQDFRRDPIRIASDQQN